MESIVEYLSGIPQETIENIFAYTKQYAIDNPRTGRCSIEQLSKAEKTILGIKFEQQFKQVLFLPPGSVLDCKIADKEVDIKFTCRNNWMIPPKCFDQFCILAQMDDSKFSLGVMRASVEDLTESQNWDRKKSIKVSSRSKIVWIYRDVNFTSYVMYPYMPPIIQPLNRQWTDFSWPLAAGSCIYNG